MDHFATDNRQPRPGEQREPLPRIALDWLREVIHTEFAPTAAKTSERRAGSDGVFTAVRTNDHPDRLVLRDPFEVAARFARGEVQHALWYREWHRRWRRFQLSDQVHHYLVRLNRARTARDVFEALTEYAVQILGGYTCLLFPPQEQLPLRPLPNPALRIDTGRMTLSLPLADMGLLGRDDVLGGDGGAYANLAPLFAEERAVSLAYAPFGEGGVILLVERRHERVFVPEDWDLLRMLSMQASAVLTRLRLELRENLLPSVHPVSALPDEAQLLPVVEHALSIAARGEPVALAGIRLENLDVIAAEDGAAAADRVRRTAAEILREMAGTLGIAIHRSDDEFVLVLPRLSPPGADGIAGRLARQLPSRVRVRATSIRVEAEDATPVRLLQRLDLAAGRNNARGPGAGHQ